jgi:hypothetical protein
MWVRGEVLSGDEVEAAVEGYSAAGKRRDHNESEGAMQEKSDSQQGNAGGSPSQLIDERIAELGDWRGETLARIRALIKEADPEVVEEWKWRGVPTWYHDGIVCTGETYKEVVKTTFAKGASLEDPSGLFNSSLEGNVRRAIDFHEGEEIDEKAFKDLIRAAVALNASSQ